MHRLKATAKTGNSAQHWNVCIHIIVSLQLLHQTTGASLIRKSNNNDHNSTVSRDTVTKHEAIERLSEVFGIRKVPRQSYHRSPPQFMMDLYHTLADPTGITKTSSPFDADVVRGFPDRGEPCFLLP